MQLSYLFLLCLSLATVVLASKRRVTITGGVISSNGVTQKDNETHLGGNGSSGSGSVEEGDEEYEETDDHETEGGHDNGTSEGTSMSTDEKPKDQQLPTSSTPKANPKVQQQPKKSNKKTVSSSPPVPKTNRLSRFKPGKRALVVGGTTVGAALVATGLYYCCGGSIEGITSSFPDFDTAYKFCETCICYGGQYLGYCKTG